MKTTSPADCVNNRQGYQTNAIAHAGLDKTIVSLSRKKGKAHNDVPQLRSSVQEIWKRPQGESAVSLQPMPQDIL